MYFFKNRIIFFILYDLVVFNSNIYNKNNKKQKIKLYNFEM